MARERATFAMSVAEMDLDQIELLRRVAALDEAHRGVVRATLNLIEDSARGFAGLPLREVYHPFEHFPGVFVETGECEGEADSECSVRRIEIAKPPEQLSMFGWEND